MLEHAATCQVPLYTSEPDMVILLSLAIARYGTLGSIRTKQKYM